MSQKSTPSPDSDQPPERDAENARQTPGSADPSATAATTKKILPIDLQEYIPDFRWPADTREAEFGFASRDDAEEINDLFNRAFDQRRPLSHFLWKYWEGPGGESFGVLAREKGSGKVLATSTGVRKRAWVDGREAPTILMCETSSDPDARGGGRLFKGVMQGFGVGVHDRAGIIWSFGGQSSDEAIKIGKRWFGFGIVFTLQPYEQRLSLEPSLRRRFGALGVLGAWVARPVVALIRRGWQRHENDFALEEVADFGPEFDALWERYRDRYRMVMWRDAATLRWRYRDCPVGTHRTLLARRVGEPAGYAVWREWDVDGMRVATVLDIWNGGDEALAESLFDGVRRAAARAGCAFVRFCAIPGSVEERALGRIRGFRLSPYERPDPIICTPMPGSAPEEMGAEQQALLRTVVDGSNWFYTQGDCDYRD